jgi:hypothetical protein
MQFVDNPGNRSPATRIAPVSSPRGPDRSRYRQCSGLTVGSTSICPTSSCGVRQRCGSWTGRRIIPMRLDPRIRKCTGRWGNWFSTSMAWRLVYEPIFVDLQRGWRPVPSIPEACMAPLITSVVKPPSRHHGGVGRVVCRAASILFVLRSTVLGKDRPRLFGNLPDDFSFAVTERSQTSGLGEHNSHFEQFPIAGRDQRSHR